MKINNEIINSIQVLTSQGKTVTDICNSIGISRKTYYKWISKIQPLNSIPDEKQTVKNNNLEQVEQILLKLATGKVKTKDIKKVLNSDGKLEHVEVTTRTVKPDIKAIMFYLSCIYPEKYNNQVVQLNNSTSLALNKDNELHIIFDNEYNSGEESKNEERN